MFRMLLKPLFSRLFTWATDMLDRKVGWHRLSVPLGILTLIGLRKRLRARNLYDTWSVPRRVTKAPRGGRHLAARAADGTFNDLESPAMGSAGMPFGRNVPLERTHPENDSAILKGPNPRTVSRVLLTRDGFKPATTLNLLAAAWLQFMVRDWFSHGKGVMDDSSWTLEREAGDDWERGELKVPRTPRGPRSPDEDSPPTFINTETHWWDGSQIYGSTQERQDQVRAREHGKLVLNPDGSLPGPILEEQGKEPGWWVGLALMFTLFAREHNAICDRLRGEYPSWSDDELFDHARLINAALMAKIHTVEWTPAILGHPTLQVAMRANWWGLAGEQIHKLFGRISKSEMISGIVGSPKDHFGVPYAITEEFAAVYRMHPLIPDHFDFYSATDGEYIDERDLRGVQDKHVQALLAAVSTQDLLYSFGIANPGALTLHNYPNLLQEFQRPDGKFMDLAATDILRSRELGVPRYNEFRRLLRLAPARSFEELTDNPIWAKELEQAYDDIDQVDLTVGLFAEPKPEGFGFSDTTFRIFILIASRRLNSDRFFTTDYTPEVYTQVGLDWISDNDMSTVLLRHFPELQPTLHGVKNAFAPWQRAQRRGR